MSVPDWTDPERRAERWEGHETRSRGDRRHASSAGLEYLLVENLVSVREPSTMARIEDLLTDGDAGHVPWRLCLDVGHQCVPGTEGAERDPYAWLQRFGSRLAEVQLQQSDGIADHHWAFTEEHNAAGLINPAMVLESLEAAGAGIVDLIFEIIPGFEDPDDRVVADLLLSVDLWRSAIDARGAES